MASGPPFGIVLPSRPVLVNPTVVSSTQYAFVFPSAPQFTHIVVFLLPGSALPEGTLAGIYIQLPGTVPEFRLLGAIGADKPSIILKITGGGTTIAEGAVANGSSYVNGDMEDEMTDIEGPTGVGDVTIGISIEPAATMVSQLEILKASQHTALVTSRGQQGRSVRPSTKVLAQRIIKNAFNFLASFAGTIGPGGQEVIPLKSFQDWWSKFERKIENDPGFLERENDI